MPEQLINGQVNIAMLGDGFYSRVSQGPKAVIDNTADLVRNALSRMPIGGGVALPGRQDVFTVADFGAADGGTSLDLVASVVDELAIRAPGRPVSIVYTDLPGADFGTLFRQADGEHDRRRHARDDVHVFASGRSFYRSILPAGSLDLGFSASAMHYLSEMPGVIEDHIHAVGASPAEQRRFQEVARRDWQTILRCRSAELAPGGRLVAANFVVDEQGRYLGNTSGHNMFDTYNTLWQAMRDEGIIDASEYRQTAFQQHYKTVAESLAPLTDPTNEVYASGLHLEQAETRIVDCPFRSAFERGELAAHEFAQQFVNTHRSWTETTFRAGLDPDRDGVEAQRVLDELYRRYEALVLHDPVGHGKDLLHLYLIAVKLA